MWDQKKTSSLSDQRIVKDEEESLAWDRIRLELLNASHVAELRRGKVYSWVGIKYHYSSYHISVSSEEPESQLQPLSLCKLKYIV